MTRTLRWLVLWSSLFAVLPSHAATRHYYIAAEDVTWDYAPSSRDLLGGRPVPLPWGPHTKWAKTRFIEYTDNTFSIRKPQPEWLGILGPIIRAEVGDTIIVDFLNRSRGIHSIHPHGLRYDKANEGAFYLPWGAGARVPPGVQFTYQWFADEGSGPGPGQLSSVVWWYHPHYDEPRETNAGLLGPIIITAKGKARPDGSPKDVDREFVASFMIFDELGGRNEGQFHAINGYIYGNLPGLVMKQGEKVRWYLMGMGNEKDIHTPHWHGKTVTDGRRNVDVVELLPGSTSVYDMLADNPGVWMLHCHVADHMEAGMMASFTIYVPSTKPCPLQFVSGKFWNTPDHYTLTVKNTSGKKIKSLALVFEHFTAPQLLHHPFSDSWTSDKPVEPGGEQGMEMKAYSQGGPDILAWVLLPSKISFADGTTWKPSERGECFGIFWRDQDHPNLEVLPPEQVEANED
jgi:manganese oxidase